MRTRRKTVTVVNVLTKLNLVRLIPIVGSSISFVTAHRDVQSFLFQTSLESILAETESIKNDLTMRHLKLDKKMFNLFLFLSNCRCIGMLLLRVVFGSKKIFGGRVRRLKNLAVVQGQFFFHLIVDMLHDYI